jgi:hypothetical protein
MTLTASTPSSTIFFSTSRRGELKKRYYIGEGEAPPARPHKSDVTIESGSAGGMILSEGQTLYRAL